MELKACKIQNRRNRKRNLLRTAKRSLLLALTGLMAFGGVACTRAKYRYKTNREAYYLIDEKIADSGEPTAPYRIEIDPRSRMFDPFNPDRPPMPEDDPVANRYMKVVDRKKGYPLWEANGRTNTAENPNWWTCLPLDERGVLVLNLEDAVRMALLHSPAYQQNLETLFLSALDVSSERFVFDSQFFGGWQSSYTADGRDRSISGQSASTVSTGLASRGRRPLSMQKRYATGTDLVVGLANSLNWQVAGPNTQSANTLLDFTLVQPLLRQGGRDVVLERLTLAERILLSNVRAFERYRRGFYVTIATGNQAQQGPARRGGVFGGAGLTGFSGLGGGFGTLGTGGQGGGNQGFANAATPGAGGFLGLLQQQLTIINTRENIARQRENLRRLEDSYRELLMTIPEVQTTISQQQLQVAQTQQSLFSLQTNLLQLNTNYEQQLDNFKRTMGLPPYLCVEIRDPMLEQFNLISVELRDRRDQVNELRDAFGVSNSNILSLSKTDRDPETNEQFRSINASPELSNQFQGLLGTIKPLQGVLNQVLQGDMAAIRSDIQRLREVIPVRRKQMDRLARMVETETDMVCSLLPLKDFDPKVLDSSSLEKLPDELETELQRLEKIFRKSADMSAQLETDVAGLDQALSQQPTDRARFQQVAKLAVQASQDVIATISESVLALQLVQARARTETALLPEVDIEPREALEIARQNRHDWINNRAALVNSWRAIELVADDLESFLDFTFSGDIQNINDNPLSLRSSTGRLRVGLVWDAPITRLQERNNYRQSLIEYQQAKRNYYQFEDNVWLGLRSTLRSIRQNQLSFELQRFAVRNAALQVSINEDLRQINETLSQASGPTTARDAVSALTDLLNSQGQLIGVWVNHEALRRSLDLDLGTMQIDADGLWIDPGPIRPDTVGGQIGPAILNYGLTENEQQIAEQLKMADRMPTELAPTGQLPSDARYVYGPNDVLGASDLALGPGLIENAPMQQSISGGREGVVQQPSPAIDFRPSTAVQLDQALPSVTKPNRPIEVTPQPFDRMQPGAPEFGPANIATGPQLPRR